MTIIRNVLLLLLLAGLAGCAGSSRSTDSAATDDAAAGPQPIRVLTITATHGFRHGDAIEASRQVLPALEADTELRFTFTEDLADLNADNLANYDLIFFNNSTLRLFEEAEDDAPVDPTGVYNISFDTPQGMREARIEITGTPDALNGTIGEPNGGERIPLQDIQFEDHTLRFSFDAPEASGLETELVLEGNEVTGTMSADNFLMDVTGAKEAGSGALPEANRLVTEAQQQAILDFLAQGKGIVVAHSGLDAFYQWDEYRAMVGGGLFEEHPWTQNVRIVVEAPDNPAVAHFGDSFEIHDEIYVLDENPRWNSVTLLSLDMDSVEPLGDVATAERNDYPISWMRAYNGGRVFVTKLGHFAEVWRNPDYQRHLVEGMRIAAGRTDVDVSGHLVKETIAEDVWPDDLAIDERGNVWIVELRGRIFHYSPETGETRQLGTLETTDPTNIEHGLYGVEIDPNFYDGEPYVYLYYAEPETFINTLARFRYENGQLDLTQPEVLLRVPTEPQCCHQAGDLEWGPDGTLYLSTGDTGMSEVRPDWKLSEEEIQAFLDRHNLEGYHWSRLVDSERSAQNLADLRGKILRINKDGTIPKDNPFFGEPGVRWEIYAYGLRNPYRFKVDPENGNVYIGIVGPDEVVTYDWYDISTEGGENFGWPRATGRLFYNEWKAEDIPNYTPPMWEYTYQTGGRSATVGPIYRHEGEGAFPPVFQDKLFVFDWARGWIKWAGIEMRAFENDTEADVKREDYDLEIPAYRLTDIKLFDQLEGTRPISMELAPDGSIYVAEFDGFWDPGPRAKVTRYRWVRGGEAATTKTASESGGADR